MIDDATVQLIEDVQEYLDGLCGSVEHEVELAVGHPAELLDHTGPIVAAVQESGDQPAVVEFAAAAATERSVPLLAGLVV